MEKVQSLSAWHVPLSPTRRNLRPLVRTALIGAAYLCAFIILDLITHQLEEFRGVVAWYPPAGVTYALLLVFGARFTPAVTIALIIGSLFIYRMPQPPYLLVLWACVVSSLYGVAAAFLRRRTRFDWQLRKARDVTLLVVTAVLLSALLAVLSVASSALTSDLLRTDVLRAMFLWWIGETVGILTVTPFLLIHVIPWLTRVAQGKPVSLPTRRALPRPTLSVIGQTLITALIFYWVFGALTMDELRPTYLIALPLIWIALDHGLKGVTIGIVVLNFGVTLAMWLFRFDLNRLGELQLLMIVNCILGLLLGAVVTNRKQAEEALRESEERYRSMYDNTTIGMYRTTPDGRILMANPAMLKMMRYENLEDLARRNLREEGFEPHYPRTEFQRKIEQEGVLYGLESAWKRKDGSTMFGRESARVFRDGKGEVLCYEGTVEDITERKHAEDALLEERNLLRMLMDNLPDAIYFKDAESRYTRVNRAIARHAGLSDPEQMMGKSDFDFFTDEHAQSAYADEQAIIETGEPIVNKEEKETWSDGQVRWVSTTKMPLRDQDGRIVGTFGISHDITERKRAEDRIGRQLEQMTALHEIDLAITSSTDLRVALDAVLGHALTELRVDAATILLVDASRQTLEFAAGRGFHSSAVQHTHPRIETGYAGQAALEGRIVHVPNLKEAPDGLMQSPLLAAKDFVFYCAAPLKAKGQVAGVLEVFHRTPHSADQEWMGFLESLSTQAAIAVDNALLFDRLQRSNSDLSLAYDATIEGWSRAMDLRDKQTEGHTQRVSEMTLLLARGMGVDDAALVHMRRGALLHDMGKIGIPDSILLKPGQLSDDEWTVMRQHPQIAYDMLSPIAYLRPALDIPYCHHEKWDGTGYPRGLQGEQIPLAARVFAVVDVWDALLSDRPYRPAWPRARALQYVREQAGKHFDPQVVAEFLAMPEHERSS